MYRFHPLERVDFVINPTSDSVYFMLKYSFERVKIIMNRLEILDLVRNFQNLIPQISGVARNQEEEILQSIGSKPIKIISGFRRSGKSFLLVQVLKKLLEKKHCDLENILYLNFENLNLSFVNDAFALNEIYQVYLSEFGSKGKHLLVLDEIQKVKDWDKFIRTIYENKSLTNQDLEIIITGSNSELLSAELSSNLAGRFVEFFVLPFSFDEFLRYRNFEIKSKKDFQRNKSEIEKLFFEFVRYGALPETFSITEHKTKYSYLEGVVNKVILDDVINRFNVKNTEIIEKILHYLMSNIGNKLSYSKLTAYIKSLGYDIKQDTIVDYVHYIEKSFALFEIAKFDWKSQSIFSGNKKYYAIDTGIANFYKGLTENFSRQLENIVYLDLVRKFQVKNIFYGNDGKEIDFIVKRLGEQIFDKYQVCQDLNDDNFNRETTALLKADEYLVSGQNILITLNNSEYELENIVQYNLIEFLLFPVDTDSLRG